MDESTKLEGYLLKQGEKGVIKTWKRRFFMLDGKKLRYFEESKEKGFIDLELAVSIHGVPTQSKEKQAEDSGVDFQEWDLQVVTPTRTYNLRAPNANSMRYWIEGLKSARMGLPPQSQLIRADSTRTLTAGIDEGRVSALQHKLSEVEDERDSLLYQLNLLQTKYLELKRTAAQQQPQQPPKPANTRSESPWRFNSPPNASAGKDSGGSNARGQVFSMDNTTSDLEGEDSWNEGSECDEESSDKGKRIPSRNSSPRVAGAVQLNASSGSIGSGSPIASPSPPPVVAPTAVPARAMLPSMSMPGPSGGWGVQRRSALHNSSVSLSGDEVQLEAAATTTTTAAPAPAATASGAGAPAPVASAASVLSLDSAAKGLAPADSYELPSQSMPTTMGKSAQLLQMRQSSVPTVSMLGSGLASDGASSSLPTGEREKTLAELDDKVKIKTQLLKLVVEKLVELEKEAKERISIVSSLRAEQEKVEGLLCMAQDRLFEMANASQQLGLLSTDDSAKVPLAAAPSPTVPRAAAATIATTTSTTGECPAAVLAPPPPHVGAPESASALATISTPLVSSPASPKRSMSFVETSPSRNPKPLPPSGAPTDMAPQPPASPLLQASQPSALDASPPLPPPLSDSDKDVLIASLSKDLEHHRRALKAIEVELAMKNDLVAKLNGNYQQIALRKKEKELTRSVSVSVPVSTSLFSKRAKKITVPPGTKAVALYDFAARSGNEISFHAGDTLILYDISDSGWWKAELNGRVGLFPGSFCRVVPAPSQSSSLVPVPTIPGLSSSVAATASNSSLTSSSSSSLSGSLSSSSKSSSSSSSSTTTTTTTTQPIPPPPTDAAPVPNLHQQQQQQHSRTNELLGLAELSDSQVRMKLNNVTEMLHEKEDAFAQLRQMASERAQSLEAQLSVLRRELEQARAQVSDKEESLKRVLQRDAQRSKMLTLLKARVQELEKRYLELAGLRDGGAGAGSGEALGVLASAQLWTPSRGTSRSASDSASASASATMSATSSWNFSMTDEDLLSDDEAASSTKSIGTFSNASAPRVPKGEIVATNAGASAPSWRPDISAPVCFSCRVSFSLLTRRHHCRFCGYVFCAACSAKSCRIPEFGYSKPVRVCDSCYDIKTNQ